MTMRPQPSLHRVLDDLGATLLELVCAPSGTGAVPGSWAGSDEIGGVAIHDPADEPVLPGRACADRALRVLRAGSGDPAGEGTAGGSLAGGGRRGGARLADVHPNTFRYRLRRLTEVSGIDLADPEQRFAAMLQLRAVYPAERKPHR
jgi:PucR C-terminal helix-turn-helix domain